MKKVTIKDIAKMANVSAATVSMVLNDKNNISQATREKVKKIADEYNYIPNLSARGLVSSRTHVIGIIMADLVEPMNAATLRAISKEISNTDYKLLLYDAFHCTNWRDNFYHQISREGRVDGVIQKALDMSDKDRDLVKALKVPLVVFENDLSWVDCVGFYNNEGTYTAAKYLVNQGHKKIGLISCRLSPEVIETRVNVVKAALVDFGLEFNPKFVYQTEHFSAKEGILAADYFHSLSDKPTAIFAVAGDYICCGFLSQIKRLGYRVPDDFALMGFDDLEISSYLDPQLTTVRQPLKKMANAAIDLLVARIQDKERPFETRQFKSELIIRESA